MITGKSKNRKFLHSFVKKQNESKNRKFLYLFIKKPNKRGEILVENVLFIVLNIIFVSILLLFLFKQGSGAILLEQTYSKQIALMIDSSKPVMEIKLNMEKAQKTAEENKIDFSEIVSITGNVVKVRLSQKGGYEYSFFNDVQVKAFPETDDKNEYTGIYVFTINEKQNKNEK